MYGAAVIMLLGILVAVTLGLLLATGAGPEPEPAADPYAAEVAAFRAEVTAWERAQ